MAASRASRAAFSDAGPILSPIFSAASPILSPAFSAAAPIFSPAFSAASPAFSAACSAFFSDFLSQAAAPKAPSATAAARPSDANEPSGDVRMLWRVMRILRGDPSGAGCPSGIDVFPPGQFGGGLQRPPARPVRTAYQLTTPQDPGVLCLQPPEAASDKNPGVLGLSVTYSDWPRRAS